MKLRKACFIAIILFMFLQGIPVSAQTATPIPGPVYIVQTGDTLWGIAIRFNTSMEAILAANNIPNQEIFPGDRIVIPGLSGLHGTLVTQPVSFGETLRSISRQNLVDPSVLVKLNHLTSPEDLYAGYNLVLLQQETEQPGSTRVSLSSGDTLFELAVQQNTDPWTIALKNKLINTQFALSGDTYLIPSKESSSPAYGLPPAIQSINLDPLSMTQGATVQVTLVTDPTASITGTIFNKDLSFFSQPDGSQVALQGVHAMLDPGVYPLRLDISMPSGEVQSFEQMLPVTGGDYLNESLVVNPETIEPAVTAPENEWLASMVSTITPEKYWQGMFQLPVDSQYCLRSKFGNRRSYNNGELYSFHSGLDFGVCSDAHPLDIYAPADGIVVFTGLKTVRGNVTIIDHGWGVYSCFFHQKEILVSQGDRVSAGTLIGQIGDTGRTTGPHLHWEVWVNGIQVNPTTWLNEVFPH